MPQGPCVGASPGGRLVPRPGGAGLFKPVTVRAGRIDQPTLVTGCKDTGEDLVGNRITVEGYLGR